MKNASELGNRIDALYREADRVSEQIRNAEDLLRDVPTVQDVRWCYLTWDHKKKRIVSTSFDNGIRPLIECPLRERISRQSEIDGLVDAVLMETESFMEKHRSAQ